MGSIKRSPVWDDPRVKPPYGAVEVDYGYPLSPTFIMLMNEGAGGPYDIGTQQFKGTFVNGPVWTANAGDYGIRFTAASTQSISLGSRVFLNPDNEFSYLIRMLVTDHSAYHCLVGGATACAELRIEQTTGNLNLLKQGQFSVAESTSAVTANRIQTVGVSYRASTSWQFVIDGTSAGSGTPGATAFVQDNYAIGVEGAGQPFDGTMTFFYYWNRALTLSELANVTYQPYAFLRPIIKRRYFVRAAAAATGVARSPQFLTLGVGS